MDSQPDSTFGIADTNDANLENFFSRPIKTQSFTWPLGATFYQKFNPWTDFFENSRVINRISNYNLLRCKLKCRIVLNGNGFYYGRAIASYIPLHSYDDFTKDRAFFIQDVVAASQRPHVYLDPTNSLGGTLTLPFCWYENALRIPSQEWRDMGSVIIHGMQDLKHANGSTDAITVSVFVWAEEVSLSVPTANEPGALTPQMGQKDEYKKDGPISKPANFVAKVAGALEAVPPIAPFAKATQMAANAVAGVASIFGYSRPTILQDVEPYRPTYLGNMANTNVGDSSVKLTLDGKQELTVDPRTMGLGGMDEMTIKSIACRESYLTAFPWPKSAVAETLLWNSEVSPVLWNELPGPPDEIHMPACCFAAVPFKYWRGSMKFRFQVIASAFHKGRLKITYDPSYPLTNEYNTNYTHIIDLAKERDFTLEIGWGHERSMVGHRNPGEDTIPWSLTPLGADPLNNGNGILSIYVVNDLTTPNSTTNNDASVNVYVSAGDNFEVFDPDSENIEDLVWFAPRTTRTQFDPQTGTKEDHTSLWSVPFAAAVSAITSLLIALTLRLHLRINQLSTRIHDTLNDTRHPNVVFSSQMAEKSESHPDADATTNENEPMKLESTEHLASNISATDNTICVYFGDPVVSFRQCLKRYNYHRTWCMSQTGPLVGKFNSLPDFPLYRGYAPDAVDSCNVPTYPTPYNYCEMTLLNYLTPAFTCRRGGLRLKYVRFGRTENPDLWYVTRNETPGSSPQADFSVGLTVSDTSDSQSRQYLSEFSHTWDGAHATVVFQNPILEVEFPYYANIRFSPAKRASLAPTEMNAGQYHDVVGTWNLADGFQAGLHSFVSTGEDFQLGFFTGCPVAYRVAKGDDPTTL